MARLKSLETILTKFIKRRPTAGRVYRCYPACIDVDSNPYPGPPDEIWNKPLTGSWLICNPTWHYPSEAEPLRP
ncbi:MAG: hypothetical protein QXZ62_03180 [Candidatus Caldarchaeum sp.]